MNAHRLLGLTYKCLPVRALVQPRSLRPFSAQSTSKEGPPSPSVHTNTATEDDAERQFQLFRERIRSDAFFRMLATPLRRCAVTRTVLPKALMFSLSSHRSPLQEGEEEEEEEGRLQMPEPAEPANALLRRRSLRWLRRDAKRTLHKTLLRSQRLLQHKVVTSQTDKSREHFKDQLESNKKQLAKLMRPPRRGQLLPSHLTRASIGQSVGKARGKAVWCMLNQKIALGIPSANNHRMIPETTPPPPDFLTFVQDGLEERVLEEAKALMHQVVGEPTREVLRLGWILRRLRGAEVRGVCRSGRIVLREAEEVPLACLIVSSGEAKVQEEGTEVYRLGQLFHNKERCEAFKAVMRDIPIRLRKRARKVQKAEGREAVEQKRNLPPKKPHRPTDSMSAWVHDPDCREKQPRLHVMKRDERTVNLSIALWRLRSWCESQESEGTL